MATIRKIKRTKGEAYQLDYIDPTTSKRYKKTIYSDHKTAIIILKETEARLARKQYGLENIPEEHITLSEASLKFLVHSSKSKSPLTTKREKIVLKTFTNYIGNPDLHDIDSAKIQEYIHHRLTVNSIRPATAFIETRVLKTFFNYAIRCQILMKNPVQGIILPKQESIKVRYLRVEEVVRFLSAIENDNLNKLALLYLNTGARRSELLPPLFTWNNVDFENRVLILSGKGNMKRYIPMNETANEILKSIKETGTEIPFNYKPDYISHKFKKFYQSAGVENANVHSLRKTFGSLLIQNGSTDLYTVSKLLGHKSYKTTEKYYVDLLDENYHSSVAQLDKILR